MLLGAGEGEEELVATCLQLTALGKVLQMVCFARWNVSAVFGQALHNAEPSGSACLLGGQLEVGAVEGSRLCQIHTVGCCCQASPLCIKGNVTERPDSIICDWVQE